MSLPQRPLLPAGMDDKSTRPGGLPAGLGPTGPYPFATPSQFATSSPSTTHTNNVFPPMHQQQLFPQNLQQAYQNLVQAHFMQMAAAQAQAAHAAHVAVAAHAARLSAGTSPVNSDQASSRSESPTTTTMNNGMMTKKTLTLDEDGFATCPACGDKLAESQWTSHIEEEKLKLIGHIRSVRDGCNSSSASFEQVQHKRENELLRIRNNQQKRQILKRATNTTTTMIRDCLTPFSRQSNDETGSSESPDTKKMDEDFSSMMKCTSCQQTCAYGIIMSSYDRPKCQMCFDIIRTQSCILTTSTSPAQNEDENESPPNCKKMKFDAEEEEEAEVVDQ